MGNRRGGNKVDALAVELGKLWGVTPRVAACRALDDVLTRERKRRKRLPRGANSVREMEVAQKAVTLYAEKGPFKVRELVRYMWGEKQAIVGARGVADAVTKILRLHGWVRLRKMREGVISYRWFPAAEA